MERQAGGEVADAAILHFGFGPERAIEQQHVALRQQTQQRVVKGRNLREEEQAAGRFTPPKWW